jgi:predicted TIM-barrel fold metal-dependent hydrolase
VIVDTHVHPLAGDPGRYPENPPPGPAWYKGVRLNAGDCIREMDGAGVDQMVLVSSYSLYAYDNSYAADAARAHPDRFVGVCRIDNLASDARHVLGSWFERGMRGVRFGSTAPASYPACERAEELGVPVSVQVKFDELAGVRQMVERFPAVDFILDHLSHPPIDDGPPYAAAADFFSLRDLPNLHFKFSTMNLRESAAGRSTTPAFLEALIAQFGAQRLMWGSDFPHTRGSTGAPYRELVDLARDALAFLPAEVREQLLAGTARRLYPSLAGASQH